MLLWRWPLRTEWLGVSALGGSAWWSSALLVLLLSGKERWLQSENCSLWESKLGVRLSWGGWLGRRSSFSPASVDEEFVGHLADQFLHLMRMA